MEKNNYDEYDNLLKKYFNKDFLKPLQKKVIKTIIDEEKDCLAILSTGYGKSICYQLPYFILNKTVIVISPLISLMEDQKSKLSQQNINVCCLNSNLDFHEKNKIKKELFKNVPMIVYITPEYFNKNLEFIQELDKKSILGLVAIDECHCISQWGNDFRPDYQKLCRIKDICKNVSILALSATLSKDIENDISRNIFNKTPIIIKSTFDRPNLKILVKPKNDILKDVYLLIENNINKKIIIYTRTRNECEKIYKIINKLDINCGIYHAGLNDNIRKDIHKKFIDDNINCIIATIAFGMGIDHDVNLIIRYGLPDNIESYYQEIGRAGRDNSIAECYLFYSYVDYKISESINNKILDNSLKNIKEKKLNVMKYYIYTKQCRRKFILNYFNEKYDIQNCKMCDICINRNNDKDNKENVNNYCEYKFKKGLKKDQKCKKIILNDNIYCSQHKNKN